jgi:hypothetical protein
MVSKKSMKKWVMLLTKSTGKLGFSEGVSSSSDGGGAEATATVGIFPEIFVSTATLELLTLFIKLGINWI